MKRRRPPHLGQRLVVDGREFRCFRVRHVVSRRGHSVPVLTWVGMCRDCGRPFEQRTCRSPRPSDVELRCPSHRGTRAERRALRGRAAVLRLLVAENPDGTLVTMSGEPIRREPTPEEDADPEQELAHGR